MDHSTHVPLTIDELTQDNLADAPVYGPDDSKIGTVSHTHGAGAGQSVVMDIGGFLGFGTHTVALPIDEVQFMRDESGSIHGLTHMPKDALEALPEHHDR